MFGYWDTPSAPDLIRIKRCDRSDSYPQRGHGFHNSSGSLAIFAAIRRALNNEKRAALSAAQVFLRAPPGDGAMVAKEQIVEGDVTLVTGAAIDHRYSFRNSSGSLAIFVAMRLASSSLSNFAAERRPGSLS